MINDRTNLETEIMIWTESVRRLILIQSDIDNLHVKKTYDLNNNISEITYCKDNKVVKNVKFFSDGKIKSQVFFSANGLFKLLIEYNSIGSLRNEKILFKNKIYGSFSCFDSKYGLIQHGYYFNGEKIGKWFFREQNGKISQMEYKNLELVDSLPSITDNFPSESFGQ